MSRNARLDVGLQHRVGRIERQIATQHRHLAPLCEQIRSALERGDRSGAHDALHGYEQAIRAHFALEDEMFFPALHGLHPEHGAALEALSAEHDALRAGVRDLADRTGLTDLSALARALDAFQRALRQHEAREEELVTAVRRASATPQPGS
ncbi:MAG: hemerythrin domain-containing protein [Myxococcota bacterium]|nr:hemerythrin domain-containing protein [Myxococcota bacterium]